MEQKKYHYKEGDKIKVYDRETGQHITGEQAAQIPDFWSQVEAYNYPSTPPAETPTTPTTPTIPTGQVPTAPVETPQVITPEQLAPTAPIEPVSPVQGIQEVFGTEWKPNPIFEQLGLTEQGIWGAVRVKGMNDVYTIGTGGRKETAESFKERFGTDSQEGIVGEISMEEAIALGIVVGADSIVEPLSNKDPYEVWAEFRDEDKEEITTLRKTLLETTQALIDKLMGYGEDKSEAKDKEKEKLGIDAKDKAISDAQKVRNDLYNSYEKLIVDLSHSTMTTAHIGGLQAKTRAQRAVELAPLDSNILIAQNSYARAKDLLDDWSADYNEAMQFQMQAAQLNISMLEGELNREQAENLEEAKIKFSIWENEFNRNLETQEEVKKLMLMFPEAGVSIADSWEDAYHKIAPYIKDEKDFEKKIALLEVRATEIDVTTAETEFIESQIGERIGGSRSWRNNNPGNIEYGEFAKSMGAIGTDGRFAIFPDEQTGTDAMIALLKSANYQNKTVDAAMRRWSGSGYGEEVAPEFTGRTMASLSPDELKVLAGKMRTREGWTAGNVSTTKLEDYFTDTQINKGASNAGMSIDEFKKLDPNTANQYINPAEEDKEFTPQELRKLEQAGLKDASRQEQLNYLYGDETDNIDSIIDKYLN